MEAIDNSKQETAETSAVGVNIALAKPSSGASIAEKVFENAWRSVVIVINGDGQGSGVIIRPNIVATNCHVVNEGGDIIVYKSANRRADTDSAFPAIIRHADEDKDFCLLDVVGLWGVPATVRKYGTLRVGEDVYGLGAPWGWICRCLSVWFRNCGKSTVIGLSRPMRPYHPAHRGVACLIAKEI